MRISKRECLWRYCVRRLRGLILPSFLQTVVNHYRSAIVYRRRLAKECQK